METAHVCLIITLCLLAHRSSSDILQRQKRNWIIDSFTIDEGYNGTFPYVLGKIQLERDLTVFEIRGQGVDEEPIDTLRIDSTTGEISVYRPVDYEKLPWHYPARTKSIKLEFQAYNVEKKKIDTRLGIEILVKDANDNPPRFERDRYEVSIKESAQQGTEIVTFMATDDDSSEENAKFDFRIASVTPEPHDLEFSLFNIVEQTGSLTFNGCLDHEKAEKYTVIVEAKDRGKDVKLSSSCTIIINIEDGNNHLPVITGQTYSGEVKEREANVLVTRLQVTDEDTEGTAAWRAVYHIHGDTKNNFRIETDPETNDGLLYVEKPMDFEESPMKNLTISVENESPYQSCRVVRRSSTSSSLWELEIINGVSAIGSSAFAMGGTMTLAQSSRTVSVTVIDVNDPPSFEESNKIVKLVENGGAEQDVAILVATGTEPIVYKMGDDPAGWFTVDPVTGKVITTKSLDRESHYVRDNVYVVTVLAIDDADPKLTSTATLSVYITDENDNSPFLTTSTFDMCETNKTSMINITVSDLDDDPYGGPFHFKLHGHDENKWRIEPNHGYSFNLVRQSSVYSGEFELALEVSDRQHKTTVLNVSVTVCSCLDPTRPNCRMRRETSSGAGVGAVGAIFLSLLLFGVVFLLLFWLSCKQEKIRFNIDGDNGQHLIISHTERPGTDCEVPFDSLGDGGTKTSKPPSQVPTPVTCPVQVDSRGGYSKSIDGNSSRMTSEMANWMMTVRNQQFSRDSMSWGRGTTSALSTMRRGHHSRNSMRMGWMTKRSGCSEATQQTIITTAINLMVNKQWLEQVELGEYEPHIYATEEDQEARSELSMCDIPAEPDLELDLRQDQHAKFTTLASICMPSEYAAYSAKMSCAEKHELKVENYHLCKTHDLKYQISDLKYEQVQSTYNSYSG